MADDPSYGLMGSSGPTGGLLADPSLWMNLGLGLLASGAKNSPLRGNYGLGLQQGLGNYYQQQQAQQQLGMGRLQMGLLQQEAQIRMNALRQLGARLDRANNAPPGMLPMLPQTSVGAPPSSSTASVPPQSPQAPPQQQMPNRYRPPPPLPSLGGDPASDVQIGQLLSLGGVQGAEAFTNSPKNLQAAQDYLIKQRQLETAEPMSILDTVAGAANASDIVRSDPELTARWGELAPRMGLNPQRDMTPENARAFARMAYNEMAASGQQPPKPMPDIFDLYPGANGQVIQKNRTTGAITEPIPQKLPTYSLEKTTDPDTGQIKVTPIMTSPGGAAAPAGIFGQGAPKQPRVVGTPSAGQVPSGTTSSAGPRAQGGGVGQPAGPGSLIGFEKPTDVELKVATLANYARASTPELAKIEASGYRMSPTVRAAVINAATSDDPGMLGQWLSQQMLAHALGPQDLQYMAALMPFLQAAGHDMTGARLPAGQMKTNFESLIPVDSTDPKYMATIANNRQQLYNGLLAGAGNASQLPEFRNTLGADRMSAQARNQLPVRVNSAAEAMNLKAGTLIITEDGRLLRVPKKNGQ